MILYLIGTLLSWSGYVFAAFALFYLIKLATGSPRAVSLGICTFGSAVCLILGSWLAPGKTLQIPLVWVILPFAGWVAIFAAIWVIVRFYQAITEVDKSERRRRFKTAFGWGAMALVACVFVAYDSSREIRVFSGGIPITLSGIFGLLALAAAAMMAMTLTERSLRQRGWAKTVITHITLILGSILFGLPFAWLAITSFKEDQDMASPNGIVWIPRVQETVPYFSPTNPLYETLGDASSAPNLEGTITKRGVGGKLQLDIVKPLSMLGTTVETTFDRLKEIPRQARVVTATLDGQAITGRVIEDRDDGSSMVEMLSPASLAGRQHLFSASEVTAKRHIGLKLQNYPDALDFLPPEAAHGLVYLKNTLVVVILGVIGTLLSSAIVAYGFSRLRFPGREALFIVMLSTMMLPAAVTKLPQFMIFRGLGWIDTLQPLWVPAFFGSALNIFLLRQFFRQIPMELEDAAKIDGCSYIRSFWSVMMPQIKPALAVITIWTVMGVWNDFMNPLIYINSPEHMTISYAVQLYSSDRGGEQGLVAAFTTLSMLPVLALFFFTQRYFIEGVTLSGFGGR